MVAAAKELGYDFSIAALEKSTAEAEPLDPAEYENIAGGRFSEAADRKEDCYFL